MNTRLNLFDENDGLVEKSMVILIIHCILCVLIWNIYFVVFMALPPLLLGFQILESLSWDSRAREAARKDEEEDGEVCDTDQQPPMGSKHYAELSMRHSHENTAPFTVSVGIMIILMIVCSLECCAYLTKSDRLLPRDSVLQREAGQQEGLRTRGGVKK